MRLSVIRNGFIALAENRVAMPPILSMEVAEHNGVVVLSEKGVH